MLAHNIDVSGSQRGDKGYWYARCTTCGTRERYDTRARAQEHADAHRLFTHVTGGRECGEPGCWADRTIKRLRRSGDGS